MESFEQTIYNIRLQWRRKNNTGVILKNVDKWNVLLKTYKSN
jgi:hypothetical protein